MSRAALALVFVAFAGCGGASAPAADDPSAPPPTGLVLTLHYDHANVADVQLSGATYTTSRKFGPYTVAEKDMPSDDSVGFVFDPSDAGRAMICGETHDLSGTVLASGCDTFGVRSGDVRYDDLFLDDVNQTSF